MRHILKFYKYKKPKRNEIFTLWLESESECYQDDEVTMRI